MDVKLTLSMNKKTIEQAKKYARKKNVSLSKLVENYLVSITSADKSAEAEISPLIKSLSGVLAPGKKADPKSQYIDYLSQKYK
jgi:hypothetical protein